MDLKLVDVIAGNDGKQVKVMAVNHPSVGYSWDYWYKVKQRFLR